MNIFNKIKRNKIQKNKFDLSHEKKLSFNMGELIPMYLEEVIPSDSFKVKSEIMIRLAPMLAPIMHRVNVYTHYFFVPNRIVWDDWEDFITGGEDGLSAPIMPIMTMNDGNKGAFQKGFLADYFGLPVMDAAVTVTQPIEISALPFRAYQTIYNEYYRDQNITPKAEFSTGDITGPDLTVLTTMRKRAWEKDYFTSALPWPQRGAAVQLPVSFNYKNESEIFKAADGTQLPAATLNSDGLLPNILNQDGVENPPVRIENLEDNATSVTINELRNATRLQEWLEKMARGGSRYAEQLLHMFNVRSSDARLQRPEYLGGGKQPIIISEVLNAAGTQDPGADPTSMQPVGEMAGHGISMGKSNGFTKTFEEHGYVIGIMSVLPRTTYSQGVERTWTRKDKLEYYWNDFAHLGEQEIKNQELYADWIGAGTNELTFGYTPRYAEYKYKQSTIHGDFRDTLKYWHMGRDFIAPPALNTQFVESDPTHDIFAITDDTVDKLWCQIYHSISAVRPMPYYSTPYL